MATIEAIREKVAKDQFEFTKHAADQSIIRRITVQQVREAIYSGRIIEDYPEDKYGPSCLIMGFTLAQKILHIHCSYPSRPLVKIITVYEPDPGKWINFEIRRN